MNTVVKLNTTTRTRTATRSRRTSKTVRRQSVGAVALLSVGLALTVLSLTHLSAGIQLLGAPAWESWAMAVGIDLGFVGFELAKLTTANEKVARANHRTITLAIWGLVVWSAAMNGFAFGHTAPGWMVYPAVFTGIAIPVLVVMMFKVGAKMWLDR